MSINSYFLLTLLRKGAIVRLVVTYIILASLIILLSNCGTITEDEKSIALETKKDSISYVIGTDIARSLNPIKDDIDLDKLIVGMKDHLDEKPLLVKKEVGQIMLRKFSREVQEKQHAKRIISAQENLKKGNEFLEKNKKNEGVLTTQNGLQYVVLKQGDGPRPSQTDKVKVHYRGTTIDGTVFDSSYDRGQPTTFQVNSVIKGWTEALLLMNVNSKYKLFIPSNLAYGQRGSEPKIGPNEVLIFEVELLGIEK